MKRVLLILSFIFVSILTFAGNYPFSVVKSGKGKQAVVFIPGFACSGEVWKETVAELQDDYTCYVLTMAGFAGVAPEEAPSFEAWKCGIARFIEEEAIKNPILVGHSVGGGLALALASDFPALPKKLVIVDTLPCLMALTNPVFKSAPNVDCRDMIQRITSMDEAQFLRMQRMSAASLTTDSSKLDELVSWGVTSDRKTYATLYCDFSNTDLRERIKNIQVPSLILLEANFRNIESAVREQYKELPAAQLKYADKGLHFVMFDDKEWFMNRLIEFIKE